MSFNYIKERLWPYAVSVGTGALTWKYLYLLKNPANLVSDLSDDTVGIGTTLLGFFLTILTLLHTIDTRRMRFIRQMGAYPSLVQYLKEAILFNFLLIIVSLFLNALSNSTMIDSLPKYAIIGFIVTFTLTLTTSLRFAAIFTKLISEDNDLP